MRWALLALLVWPGVAWAADARWDRWQMLMWQDHTPAEMQGLARLGFTGAKLFGTGGHVDAEGAASRLRAGLPFYLENIATDFYAAYHRYTPGKSVNWLFDAARALHRQDPADPAAFVRRPGLSDPVWSGRVRDRLDQVVREQKANRPLFYNLADESGIADLAAAWDFDLAPESVDGFRAWLQTQYPDIAALNAEWGTGFAGWGEVTPELTDSAVARTDQNFSRWSDFKAWMDVAFSRAVTAGRDAVHGADPDALAALEGGQVPGWGGYDYSLLAPAVDVMEIYDFGDALDLATAFNPGLIPLRTSFGTGAGEAHSAWHALLHGVRGEVIWDEAGDVVGADGAPGPRGLELSALARAMTPVAALLHGAAPAPDPVAILYSPESFRVTWLLDRHDGDRDWAARDAEREYDDNAWRASRRVLLGKLGALAVEPRFVSAAMLQAGLEAGLEAGLPGVRVLFLPHAIALSDAEVAAIRAFMAAGGTVLADTEPGVFDGHGRRRANLPLPEVARPEPVRELGGAPDASLLAGLSTLLAQAGAAPRVRVLGVDRQLAPGVEARWFQQAGGLILALQTTAPGGTAVPLTVRLPRRMVVTNLRTGAELAPTELVDVSLDEVEPTLLLLKPQ